MKVLIKSNKGSNSIPSIQNTFNEQMTILYIRMENRSKREIPPYPLITDLYPL